MPFRVLRIGIRSPQSPCGLPHVREGRPPRRPHCNRAPPRRPHCNRTPWRLRSRRPALSSGGTTSASSALQPHTVASPLAEACTFLGRDNLRVVRNRTTSAHLRSLAAQSHTVTTCESSHLSAVFLCSQLLSVTYQIMENLTSNTRSTPISTENSSSSVLFVLEGTFGGGTATLEWSEEIGASTSWSAVKDINDADVTRTANSNGIVGVGRIGYLSVVLAGATSPNINISIIAQ